MLYNIGLAHQYYQPIFDIKYGYRFQKRDVAWSLVRSPWKLSRYLDPPISWGWSAHYSTTLWEQRHNPSTAI